MSKLDRIITTIARRVLIGLGAAALLTISLFAILVQVEYENLAAQGWQYIGVVRHVMEWGIFSELFQAYFLASLTACVIVALLSPAQVQAVSGRKHQLDT